MKKIIQSFLFFIPAFCFAQQSLVGNYDGTLMLHQNVSLPFSFSINKTTDGKLEMTFINGDEKITATSVIVEGDSIFIVPSVFQTEIRAALIFADENVVIMNGVFIDHARSATYTIPFHANNALKVSDDGLSNHSNFNGKWESHFSPGTADSSVAVGIFNQKQNLISGTFLTTTGDYRFLNGKVYEKTMFLSAFDGAHLFLFTANMNNDGTLSGMFYSGSHHSEPWIAKRNENFSLPPADQITWLKDGYTHFDFSFPDITGKNISASDSVFKNKVMLVQISGSWCPNCLDETKYLVPLYQQLHNKGLEIVMLDFERKSDSVFVHQTLQHIQDALHIPYPVLFAGTTTNASASLPMLNQVAGYPTLVFIDKKGVVRKIETGINGPATGPLYQEWKDNISIYANKLLSE